MVRIFYFSTAREDYYKFELNGYTNQIACLMPRGFLADQFEGAKVRLLQKEEKFSNLLI